jgi:hypothetical protein
VGRFEPKSTPGKKQKGFLSSGMSISRNRFSLNHPQLLKSFHNRFSSLPVVSVFNLYGVSHRRFIRMFKKGIATPAILASHPRSMGQRPGSIEVGRPTGKIGNVASMLPPADQRLAVE